MHLLALLLWGEGAGEDGEKTMTSDLMRTVIHASEALRRARQLLESIGGTVVGLDAPPATSPLASVLRVLAAAEAECHDALLSSLKAPATPE